MKDQFPIRTVECRVTDMTEPNIRPQESGNRWGCDWAELSCACGMTLTVKSDKPFSFSASEYTQEELETKMHWDELEKCGSSVLCVDYRQNGIGSNACGPKPFDGFVFDEKNFTFSFTIAPEMR